MAHFSYTTTVPTLPTYLFEADLVVPIIPPQDFTAVPTRDGTAYLHWGKDEKTSDSYSDLYVEVYRSTDLETWTLLDTLQWALYSEYTDSDVLTDMVYYYRLRFIRRDADSTTLNTSTYTVPLSVRIVTLLGFEPRDTYSNKFFKYLIDSLPGTRIYDRTQSAYFSSDSLHLWQTTCKILDGFNVYIDGSLEHSEDADSTALYSKRNISFMLDKKQSKITSLNTTDNTSGDTVHVNAYLIHTFLMGYAIQFLKLYETYLQLVANKFIDFSQTYTKGFKPVVSANKNATVADLYYSFGQLLGLKALKSQNLDQGLYKYKQMLKNSFSNLDNLGKVGAVRQAGEDTLGITTANLLEYHKYHWLKSDREHKLYVVPSGADEYCAYVTPSGSNNNLKFTLDDNRFWSVVQYSVGASGIGLTGAGEGYLEALGSSSNDPYSYLFNVQVSDGVTTANNVIALFSSHPVASSLITVTNSGADTGAGDINTYTSGELGKLLRLHSPWVGWEDSFIKMYGKSYQIKDTLNTLETGTDTSNMSVTLSKEDPTYTFVCNSPPSGATEYSEWSKLENNSLVVVRDDGDSGISYYPDDSDPTKTITLVGEKRVLFKIDMTTSRMDWVKKATLKLFVERTNVAGYLRLYRIRKKYDSSNVCWNYRDKAAVTSGWEWDNTNKIFDSASGTDYWVTDDWETDGAKGDSDVVFLKEFYLSKIDSPSWVSLDITDIINNIYKYEVSRLNMGSDNENILQTGFMLTAEDYADKSYIIMRGHTDSEFRPKIVWERLAHGYYQMDPDNTKYFYVDGTTRYGRLLVMDSDREPISYIKTVHEKIRQENIKFTSDVTVVLSSTPPSGFTASTRVYGETSKAVGKISSITNNNLYIDVEIRNFEAGETIRLLSDDSVSATISSVSYTGNKYIKLSRVPVSDSIIRVYHTGTGTSPATPPSSYPGYETWSEGGDGIEPVFLSSVSGVLNRFASRDTTDTNIIHLNTTDSLSTIGDVIVTYQYDYNFVILGRARSDSDSVYEIGGSNRLSNGAYYQRENDYLYGSELLLPMASSGQMLDISGDSTVYDYSEYNMGILSSAIANIKRYNSAMSVFKYDLQDKPYRFGHLYHSFLRKV